MPTYIATTNQNFYFWLALLFFLLCPWPSLLVAQAIGSNEKRMGQTATSDAIIKEEVFGETNVLRFKIDSDAERIDGAGLNDWTESPKRSRVFSGTVDDLSWRLRRSTWRERSLFGAAGLRLVAWDERYLDSRDRGWGPETAFEQNRTFAGMAWRSMDSSQSRIEFGYLNQNWDDPGPNDRRFHFFSLNFYY